ncbi:hypothetical protein ID866_4026 [Astraeus odoratus]|nr:hypothetical protein ID866_4026 [Astraeus odoratus]
MNHNEPTSPTPQEGCTYSTDESTSSDHQPLTAPSSEASVVGQNSLDVLKGFKVSLGDSTMKVLPAALKKYKINENDWQKYVIFICYGSPGMDTAAGNRIERCLNYDEKPLLLFQTLKNANKNPVFMLKHTKDIRSPIAISRAKYATRRACTVPTPSSSGCQLGGDSKDDWDFVCAPAELDVATQDSANDAKSRGASTPEGGSSQSNRIQMTTYAVAIYPYMAEKDDEFDVVVHDHRIERCLNYDEKPLLLFQQLKDEKKNPVFVVKHRRHLPSPVAVALKGQTKRKAHVIPKDTTTDSEQGEDIRDSVSTSATLVDDARSSAKSAKTRTTNMSSSLLAHTIKKKSCYGAVVSYAIAVYPYAAEQQDEFDISLGDTFVVIFQARNWWVVQRDRIGSGLVDMDTTKQGLAPSGCLLETTVPVASAIAEARTTALNTSSNAPILPKSIISPSCTGNVTTDHKKMGEEEVDVASGDIVRVFRRYDHWSYVGYLLIHIFNLTLTIAQVVKEDGDRGWVPGLQPQLP